MKKLSGVICIGMASAMAFSLASCGGKKVENADKRPTIYISAFNGGYGIDWLNKMVSDYNAERTENAYQIAVRDSKDEFSTVSGYIKSNTAVFDMFFSNANVYQLFDGGFLEPLTDVFDSKPDGSEKSIREMLTNTDYITAYTGKDGELYAIPFQESLKSFVYDHDVFLQYCLLFNEAGNFISSPSETLSKGKDGVAGTYDDGHPITEEQWEAMVAKANQLLGTAFNYSGKFASYTNDLAFAILAQYDGVEAFKTNYTFNGEYEFSDGTKTAITIDNGYLLAEAPGKLKAYTFLEKYLSCKDSKLGIKTPYINSKAGTLSYSHTDAQNDYILSNAQNKSNKIAMLYEGDWWENEAKTTFKALEAEQYAGYTFKTRNYKFMTLPIFEGQKEEGCVYPIGEAFYVALKKQTDDTKKAICKDFIKYMYQPKYIQNYAVTCGGVMPYDVQLTAEQEASLSPFAKNLREIYYDKNNKFISAQIQANSSDAIKAGLPSPTSNGSDYIVVNGLYYYSSEEYMAKQKAYFEKDWSSYVSAYNNYLANK